VQLPVESQLPSLAGAVDWLKSPPLRERHCAATSPSLISSDINCLHKGESEKLEGKRILIAAGFERYRIPVLSCVNILATP
jgi:hypothetical protein